MFKWKRLALAIGGLLLLALIFIMLILPGMIIDRASRWVTEETGRTLEIESISINPFSLTVEVRNLQLSDTDLTKPFAAWEQLRVSLSMASLYHRAPVIDELRIDRPEIHLEKITADRFNFSDLIPEQDKQKPVKPAGEPTRFSINNISINDGQIDFIDSSLEEQIHHTVRNLQLVLPVIGNLPYMVENPAQPIFRAEINDAPFNLKGQLKPFTTVQEMQFDIVLENIDLPFYLGYVPIELPLELRKGKLNIDLDVLYRISSEAGGELELSGRVDLVSLDIWDRLQEQLFFLPLLQVEIAPSHLLKPELHLSALRAYNLEVQLKRDHQGNWNHARIATSGDKETNVEEEPVEASTPFKLMIDTIEIHDGIVYFKDDLPSGGFKTVARSINLDIKEFALDAKDASPFTLALKTEREEIITLNGQLLLSPFTMALQSKLNNIQLAAYEPYYREVYNKPFGGSLSLEVDLLINPEQPLLISNGKIFVRDFHGDFNDKEGAHINDFDVAGLSYALNQNRLEIDSVSSHGAQINFSRNKTGEWSFLSRNFPILAKLAEATAEGAKPEAASPGPAISYHIHKLDISDWDIAMRDDQPATPVKVNIDDLYLLASNLAAPEKTKSPFTFGMTVQRKGKVALQGTFALADLETSVDVKLKGLPLQDLAPYVAEQANLILADGSLNAHMKIAATPVGESVQTNFSGSLGVSRMHLLDGTHREDLLKWDSLQIAGIKGELPSLSLDIESVTLSDYFAKILIDENAQLNMVQAFQKGTDKENATNVAESDDTIKGDAPDIHIGKVILQGGQVDFTDRSLPYPFNADMRELGGLIEGLSSASDSRATVDLRGSLRNQSPLTISGMVNPLAEQLFLDLELNFRDIEMSPFSPYSSNFVGYLIEKGKLNLTLNYSIDNNQLKASNKIFLDQFSFGAAVESEEAISLPVKLAVALLKDHKGEIHLDIPVYGSLDDPQFSVAGVIWTVIKNLLVKAATSPFALIGAMLGGVDEDFSNVSFELGSARLSPPEKNKLLRMAQALVDRPNLEVEVSGFIDPDNDAEGYRREQLSMQIKRLKYLELLKELPEGTDEEDVTVTAEEYPDFLWQVYSKADFPKPRNFIGMTKKLPEAEMEKLLYANTLVTQDHLSALAQTRALTVQNFLIEEGQLARERIFLKKPDITAAPKQETTDRARVELNATVR
jgi:uncharacterized protein involved in outer membrane biogenesis